ncbi:ABC transporter substrate-binding protein [Pseudomonas endophytica]|uniref:ABC transporter substrate-binding protein n=1 Tax=Pseudomonas endophytica TaxID=1563157 RepID=A0A0Q0SSC9_9PSED|nr:helical backbone metal receptor [Pseudomonas endophytica]KQB55150.1 ABC transporter substrate-binding protein [Pseudomonas endophytica]
MRLSTRLILLCAGFMISHASIADELPQRWVSAGGALSEWVSALGAESKLVGVDTTSQHPQLLRELPSIGYQRQLAAEGILSLKPDVLIGTEEMGPPPVLTQIRNAGVPVEMFSAEADVPTLKATLEHLGRLLGDEAKAAQLFKAYQQQLDEQQQQVKQAQANHQAPGVLLLMSHAGGKPMVAGKDTAADWLLTQAGGRNLATHSGYKILSVEALAGLNPEVLVLADRSLSGEEARKALMKENPILASLKAAKEGRIYELDPTLLVGGLGPRLPASLKQLTADFYPETSANR